jgi:FAD/FMN-containing dehydrogenase
VLAPGELVQLGGPVRKDVAGYDLKSLMIGSEGTLGVITAVWLRLIPAPQRAPKVIAAFFDSTRAGCDAVLEVLASGLQPEAIEFLDGVSFNAAAATFPGTVPKEPSPLLLLFEMPNGSDELEQLVGGEVLGARAIWAWRDTVHGAVTSLKGGKLSEDIAVPVEKLAEALERLAEIGRRRGVPTCAWGHAGDGNIHATFLIEPGETVDAEEVFDMALSLGGTVSGEHGLGALKRTTPSPAHRRIKDALDPKGLLNPGKKRA